MNPHDRRGFWRAGADGSMSRALDRALVRRVRIPFPRWAELVPPYAIGSVAMFWVIQRIAAF